MLSTNSIYLIFFFTGITVGFGHCIGMCGPIVISLALHLKDRPGFIAHVLYNTGRVVTYGIMGAIVGATASFTRFTGGIAGMQKTILIASGVVMMLMGLAMTGWIPAGRIFSNLPSLGKWIGRIFRRLIGRHDRMPVYFALGLVLGLLPCGPVYTALIAAARSGMETQTTLSGLFSGAGIMLSFGLGTIPSLIILSRISSIGRLRYREVLYKIGAVAMVVMGGYFVYKGMIY